MTLDLNASIIYEVWQNQGGQYWQSMSRTVEDSTNPGLALASAASMVDPENEFAMWPGGAVVHLDLSTGQYVTDVEPTA